jgi:hypothetical protein
LPDKVILFSVEPSVRLFGENEPHSGDASALSQFLSGVLDALASALAGHFVFCRLDPSLVLSVLRAKLGIGEELESPADLVQFRDLTHIQPGVRGIGQDVPQSPKLGLDLG